MSRQPPPINYATKPSLGTATPTLPPRKTLGGLLHKLKPSTAAKPGLRKTTAADSHDAFSVPIDTSEPALSARSHALQPLSIQPLSVSGRPVDTQRFYSNLYLGSQRSQIYPMPYVMKWSGRGIDVNHIDQDQHVFGPDAQAPVAQFYFCPVNVVSLGLSSMENLTDLKLTEPDQFSIGLTLTLENPKQNHGSLQCTVVQGSAFVTARYSEITPSITSVVLFRNVECITLGHTFRKWRVTLEDGKLWLVYASSSSPLDLKLSGNGALNAARPWTGILQIIKMPTGDPGVERLFDSAAGTYPTAIKLGGYVAGEQAQYSFEVQKVGSQPALMYALPHHMESFNAEMHSKTYPNTLASPTNGIMSLVWADSWHMQENLPSSKQLDSCPIPNPHSLGMIESVLQHDSKQDFESQVRGDSMYFCGKALNKLAQVTVLASRINSSAFQNLLSRLETNLLFFVRNQQQYPLVYENTWGGVVSVQGFTNGDGSDFGNTWYNDHHYHYGYHISSAAIYLELNPSSAHRREVEQWAKMLVRDVASPKSDAWFSAYRSMDWFVGHSWSKGLYESADGKDEESSSEDYHFTYAMYLLGNVIRDRAMVDRAKIQLAVQSHSIRTYMLYGPDNRVIPDKLKDNCVSGIKFENKVDYTTFFGNNREYIHGIHVLPITPITPFFRTESFVKNEWKKKTRELTRLPMDSGWKGLLFAALGVCEGEGGEAWDYLSKDNQTDSGVCRSWLLAMISAV